MPTVHIARNPLDLSDLQTFETDNIHELLKRELPEWPPTARIYHKEITQRNDVTPVDEATAERLGSLKGPLYAIVYPAAAQVLGAAAVYAVAYVVSAILADRTPKPREHTFYNGSPNNELSKRSNSARVNQRIPDIFGVVRAVPDLIQWSYITYENHFPVETSLMCIGIGDNAVSEVRDGDIRFQQIKDASAVVYPPGQAPGGGSPNLVIGTMIDDPAYTVIPVTAINHQQLPPINAFRCHGSGKNGIQRQGDIGGSALVGAGVMGNWAPMIFREDGVIIVPTNGDPDYVMSRIRVGDELQVAWGTHVVQDLEATVGAGPEPNLSAGWAFGIAEFEPFPATPGYPANGRVDLDPLVVTDVTVLNALEVQVTCTVPFSLSTEWAKISPYSAGAMTHNGVPCIANKNCYITAQNRFPIGYIEGLTVSDPMGIFIDDPLQTELWMNIVAPRGLYLEDGVNRKTLTETIAWFIQPCDQNGTPTADPGESGFTTLKGSLIGGETRAVTVKIPRVTPGRCRLLVCRTSQRVRQEDLDPKVVSFFRPQTFNLATTDVPVGGDAGGVLSFGDGLRDTPFTGNVTDDLELAEVYSMSLQPFVNPDCTLIHTKTVHNASAARVQERQINCIVTRAIKVWDGVAFSTLPTPNADAENILFHVMQDAFIGNRQLFEIDVTGIAATYAAIREYFGDETATEFSYTFDDHNTSFEETVAIICQATFGVPYRQGNVLKVDPEIATDDSVGLYNHRNKIPRTETRTVTFGRTGDNDGAEQLYVDIDKGNGTFTPIPQENEANSFALAPLQSRIVGLRFRHQAAWHAYRQLARMTHQHTAVQFEATQEAALLNLKQRVLIEDNTRPDVQDGYVEDISGLVIRTSQKVTLVGGSTYTVFLHYTDGSAQGIAVTAGPDAYSLTLGSAPAMSLVTDPATGRQTGYMLVRDQSATGKAFLVTEKSNNNQMTYDVTAVNYSHMYYHADSLIAYLPISNARGGEELFDRSPYERPNNGTIADTASDSLRGLVYNGTNASDGILLDSNIQAAIDNGYTKMCWVNKADGTNRGPILESTATALELFEVAAAVVLRGGHNGAFQVTYTNPTSIVNEWIHAALTYNTALGRMRLYFNGELVDEDLGVANRTLGSLTAFRSQDATFAGRLIGKADQLRHYCRELSPAMVRETYQKELILP